MWRAARIIHLSLRPAGYYQRRKRRSAGRRRNIEQLAEKISYLIENEDIRKKMGQQARMDVQRFRIENIAEQWKQLFESLIIPVNENK